VWTGGGLARGAAAEPATGGGSGYCDWVEGAAASQAALLLSPDLFASLGYIDQGPIPNAPEPSASDSLRVTAGVGYRLSGLYQGVLLRDRAAADCRRYRAAAGVQGQSNYRALSARAKVLDQAVQEADKMLDEAERDLRERRASAQDVDATRLRVEELRTLQASTRTDLAALGAVAPAAGGGGDPLREYYDADDELTQDDGSLRRAQAWDVSVRVGYDAFTGSFDDDQNPLFAVVSVGFNLGGLFQGGAEEQSVAGRRRYVREERAATETDPTLAHLRVVAREEKRRLKQTAVLVGDLERQLGQLDQVGGEAGRRYRQSLWFDWVKLKAEHAYLSAHVAGLAPLVGGDEE
jgi:hypothetical protein